MVSCAINGLGLALVIPCVQSLVADYHPSESRGKAFGFMFFTASCGMSRHTTALCFCVCAKAIIVPLRSLDLCNFVAPFQRFSLQTASSACDTPACTYHQLSVLISQALTWRSACVLLTYASATSPVCKEQMLICCTQGGMIGGFFATNIGSTMPFGMDGWRFAFHLMALVSLVTSGLVFYIATDPRPTAKVCCDQLVECVQYP